MTSGIPKDKIGKKFRLRSMVTARIFAEATVALILGLSPLFLLSLGVFDSLSTPFKVLVFVISPTGLILLPAYAFITWRVDIDEQGISTYRLAGRQSCQWSAIKKVTRRANWNWLRYVIEHENGELSFPTWINKCDELVGEIRNRMPCSVSTPDPYRKFSQDPVSIIFHLLSVVFGLALTTISWFFFAEIAGSANETKSDMLIVLCFCLIFSGLTLWRASVIARMPVSLQLMPDGAQIRTLFVSTRRNWHEIKDIKPTIPLLPEGFTLKTGKGSFYLGEGMDSLDELVNTLKEKLPEKIEEKSAKAQKE